MSYYHITSLSRSTQVEPLLRDLSEVSSLSGLHPEMIEEFLRGHLVTAVKHQNGTVYFDEKGLSRLKQIAYLREHEHTSLRTIRYIIELLDNLGEQEKEIHELRNQLH